MTPQTFTDWKNSILWGGVTGSIVAATTWSIWITQQVLADPYREDRTALFQSIEVVQDAQKELLRSVIGNTEEIIALRIKMAEIQTELH
jgi:hypothetical protein